MMSASPHHAVREDWLALGGEDIMMPDQPILDAHHHLWDRPEGRYRVSELMADVAAGHDVRASVYVQCRTGYRTDGPVELQPVGEVETIRAWARERRLYPVGIIAFADLQLGSGASQVLEALLEAGQGSVCGIRNTTAYHPDPRVRSNPRPAPDGLLRSDAFRAGAAAVARRGLVLDIWAYQSQLDEVYDIARALPELTVVVDHCGGPLGVGPYRRGEPECFRDWTASLAKVATLPNTRIKIGGFGLAVVGFSYGDAAIPPHSTTLAADWAPYVDVCISLFGPDRAMFESNFPVDKGQFSYVALWNAFKRLGAGRAQDERDALFWRSAVRCYGLDEGIFNDKKRKGTP